MSAKKTRWSKDTDEVMKGKQKSIFGFIYLTHAERKPNNVF